MFTHMIKVTLLTGFDKLLTELLARKMFTHMIRVTLLKGFDKLSLTELLVRKNYPIILRCYYTTNLYPTCGMVSIVAPPSSLNNFRSRVINTSILLPKK